MDGWSGVAGRFFRGAVSMPDHMLLVSGRLLGEAMLRISQPAVIGQLIAGTLLGPSILGEL